MYQGKVRRGYPMLRQMAQRDPARIVRWAATHACFRLEMPQADAWVLDAFSSKEPEVSLSAQRLMARRLGRHMGRDVQRWRDALAHWRRTR